MRKATLPTRQTATGKQTGLAKHDRVTALDTGVDGTVRRISTEYEVRGMRETITSWNNASVTSGAVVGLLCVGLVIFGCQKKAAVSPVSAPATAVGSATPMGLRPRRETSDGPVVCRVRAVLKAKRLSAREPKPHG